MKHGNGVFTPGHLSGCDMECGGNPATEGRDTALGFQKNFDVTSRANSDIPKKAPSPLCSAGALQGAARCNMDYGGTAPPFYYGRHRVDAKRPQRRTHSKISRVPLLDSEDSIPLRRSLGIHKQQDDPADERERSDSRRDKVAFCGLNVYSEEVNRLSRSRVADARVPENDETCGDQNNRNNCFCVHI